MPTLRIQTANVFNDYKPATKSGKLINAALFILIFANVVMIILESVPAIELKYHNFFKSFELISVIIFSVEYLARLWSCVDLKKHHHGHSESAGKDYAISHFRIRLHYIKSPLAIIDLLAILPFFLSMFFVLDLRFLRILRLLRIFKLTRYSAAMKTLLTVLKDEMPVLFAAYFIMFTIIILASSGIYLLEHDVQPEEFGNIPASMWWAVVSLTTVGYGDVIPITIGGKIFGGIITLIGISMVALPTGIIASGFGNAFRRKRQTYQLELAEAFNDGVLTKAEKSQLRATQETLGLSTEDAKQIYKEALYGHLKKHEIICPKCQKKTEAANKGSDA